MASIADAVVAAVRAAVPGRQVLDGQLLTTPDRSGHVVVYCDEGQWDRAAVAASADTVKVGWQVSSFGPTRAACGWLQRRITAHLLDNPLAVEGFVGGVVVHDYTRAPSTDEDVKEFPIVQAVDQFSMWLVKA